MTKRKRIVVGTLAALVGGGIAFVYANREKTRFRLSFPPGDVVVTKNVAYVGGSTNPKHRLDVYAPPTKAGGGAGAPVVLFVHGGYWVEGDKDFHAFVTGLYGSVGTTLAKKGIVTVVQSYRLAPEVSIEGAVDDVMAGLRWTQQHAAEHGGDPTKLFMVGHSAGGHLVALAGTDDALHTSRGMDPKAVRGYVPISAVWDVAEMSAEHGADFNERVTYRVFGRDPAKWAQWSPLSKLHAGMAPFFVMIGERDFPYMIPQAEKARAKLVGLDPRSRFLSVPGHDHSAMVLDFGASNDAVSDAVVDFVVRHD